LSTSAFRLLSGAAAPLTKPAGACVEIVFVRIRLCDRLNYASPPRAENARFCRFGCALGSEAILLRARLVFGRDQPRNGFAEVRLAGGTCATEPPEWPAMGGAVPGDTGTASIGNA
jgi:hypothetical protein